MTNHAKIALLATAGPRPEGSEILKKSLEGRPVLFREHVALTFAFTELGATLDSVKAPLERALEATLIAAGNYKPTTLQILPQSNASFSLGNIHLQFEDLTGLQKSAYIRFSGGPGTINSRAEVGPYISALDLRDLIPLGQFLSDPEQFSAANPGYVIKK